MIKIKIIALGRLKEDYLRGAASEYKKRLSRYCDLEICEIEPAYISGNGVQSEIDAALEKEADAIIKKIPVGAAVMPLCIEGKQLSSEDLAREISSFQNSGTTVVFIIGSSFGLSQRIKQISGSNISMSKMTFPHQLARIMLLEQIYRAFKINEGGAYHK